MSLRIECEYLLYQSFGIGLLPRLNREANRFERCRSMAIFFILLGVSSWLYTIWCLLQDLPPVINFNVVSRIVQHVLINVLYLEFLIIHHFLKFDKLQHLWASLHRIDIDFLTYFKTAPSKLRYLNVKLPLTNAIYLIMSGFYFWAQPNFFAGFIFFNEFFIKFCLHTSKFIMVNILQVIRLRLQAIGDIVERNESSRLNAYDTLMRIHTRCADAIDLCNELYGVNFALALLHVVLYVLRLVSIIVNKDKTMQDGATLMMLIIWTIYGFVQVFMVVYMSQKVTDAGNDNIGKLYKAMNYYNDVPIVRKRLSRLAKQIQARSPSLTAAGFFNVDHSTLFTLVNLITTYTIVLIQFSTSTALQEQQCPPTVNFNSTAL